MDKSIDVYYAKDSTKNLLSYWKIDEIGVAVL